MKSVKTGFKIFCFYLLILGQIKTSAQKAILFNNLTIENGLSQNSVMAIAQDQRQFLWIGTKYGLNRYDGYQFRIYRNSPGKPGSISNSSIQCLLTDSKGTLWVGTANGLNKYDQKKDLFIHINTNLKNNSIECIYEDKDKNLWVGTNNGLLLITENAKFKTFFFNRLSSSTGINMIRTVFKDKAGVIWIGTPEGLIRMIIKNGTPKYEWFKHDDRKPNSLSSGYITSILTDAKQNLWIGTDNGINLYHPSDNSFTSYTHNNTSMNSIVHNDVRKIIMDKKGMLWIGTQEGLSIFDPEIKKFSNYQRNPEIKNSLNQNSIHSIFQDVNGTMWIGTYYGGINFIYPYSTEFTVLQNNRYRSSISSNVVSSIVEDEKHNLWIGTEGGGLNYFNRTNSTYTYYKNYSKDTTSLTSNLVKIVYKDKAGNILIGTHHGGLNVFNRVAQNFKRIINVRDDENNPGSAEIVAISEDSYGNIWIGSQNGLSQLPKVNGQFKNHTIKSPLEKKLRNKDIRVVFEDKEKNLWIGTAAGLNVFNNKFQKSDYFLRNERDSNSLQSDFINCIVQTSKAQIWIGTYFGGISLYNPKNKTFKTYTEKDGLANNNVLGILEDLDGNLWISTDNGLSKFSLKTKKFKNYTRSDGLAANEFNIRSFFKDSKGELIFGGYNGLTSFYPEQIEINNYAAPIIFTELKLFNQPVEVGGSDKLLQEDIYLTKKITFGHDQNHFTIGFALLNFIKSDKNRYNYKLEGYDKYWTHTHTPRATYTNLPSGEYSFIVRGVNNDGIPGNNSAVIKIRILPPIWATWWAYLIYFLVFAALLFLTMRYLLVRAMLKRSEDIQRMKLDFFTNISHEIRTPLTLILGPLENLLKNTQNNLDINKQVLPIKNNADRLMRLITELLDFRKAETGHLKLSISKGNITSFTHEIFLSFQYTALNHNIQYSFESPQDSIELFFDKNQLEKVLFNLLSNAFKFTADNGQILVSVLEKEKEVEIKIRDNGKGIPYESQSKLFSNFFQVDEHGSSHIGSGIGLALSKSIVESHHGTISIESSPATAEKAGDTCFTVKLQKGKSHFKPNQLIETIQDEEYVVNYSQHQITGIPVQEETKAKPLYKETVLIVEDNTEIRHLISASLHKHYQILESVEGLSGWETAIELIPDLIICDVMMPVMDGLELCRKLKTDERTSHIPVILLTARSSHIHQISGFETGADAYITKPFSMELLNLNVRNLLSSRAAMRQKFSQQVNLQPQNITVGPTDHAFMTKILQYIDENMSDENFGVPELASKIGMSQPVLYKKIRAITDLSVNDFIKSIRLKKAAQLLEQKIYTISEVSYTVGFNDPKYFSREFRKQYGQTPRAFIQSINANK